jgi:hypothetical protein
VGVPPIMTRTRWRFGSNRRLVATIEWLRLFPNPGFFPQTAQIFDMSGRKLYLARLVGRGSSRAKPCSAAA